jgi:hypothetical protein
MLDILEIEVSRTADGRYDYMQIRSPAAAPVNIVLIAKRITVLDHRTDHSHLHRRAPRKAGS